MRKNQKNRAFTIVELLVVMSIIVILISVLVPSLNAVRRYAKGVTQKGQFHNIENALEMFQIDYSQYPDSAALDTSTTPPSVPYCGAMKMCEALMGQDGFGFHPDSKFYASGQDGTGAGAVDLYLLPTDDMTLPANKANLRERKKYLESTTNRMELHKIKDYFTNTSYYLTNEDHCAMIADVFKSNTNSANGGEKIGMPVLYYRADASKISHDPNSVAIKNKENIYDYTDNLDLLDMFEQKATGGPVNPSDLKNPLYDPDIFYKVTLDKKANTIGFDQPYRKDSYILISAGFDGLYGTRDDITNFKD